jgi:hypothetical protein
MGARGFNAHSWQPHTVNCNARWCIALNSSEHICIWGSRSGRKVLTVMDEFTREGLRPVQTAAIDSSAR